MTGKLVLIGGVSGVGKTTLAERLCRVMGCPNIRIHNYVLKIAKERMVDPIKKWDSLLRKSVPLIIEDVERWQFAVCDYHFAIQPRYDTAYAVGEIIEEDLNEPYVKGLCDAVLKIDEWSKIRVYPLLLDAPTNHILSRRKRACNIKRPRSLNPKSIEVEKKYERQYFEEARNLLDENHGYSKVVKNKEGSFEQTFKGVLEHIMQ